MGERFLTYLFKSLGESIERIKNATTGDEVDAYTDSAANILEELKSVVTELIS